MTRSEFSESTEARLRSAGWHPDRRMDLEKIEEALRSEGYVVHACVSEFLRSFAGLKIDITKKDLICPDAPPIQCSFQLNPLEILGAVSFNRVSKNYSVRVGRPLCVIGIYLHGQMVLMMDERGAVFGGYDETLIHIARDGKDALEALCRQIPPSPEKFLGEIK